MKKLRAYNAKPAIIVFAIGLLSIAMVLLIDSHSRVMSIQKAKNLPPFGELAKVGSPDHNSLIRIVDETTKGKCSAFVVDNNYAITAAHCLVENGVRMHKHRLKIYNDQGQDTNIVATPAAVDLRRDVGLIIGNFLNFKYVQTSLDGIYVPNPNHTIAACGFPGGSKHATCTLIANVYPTDFGYTALGMLYPGMSGGPVILFTEIGPIAVGVNSYVAGELNPLGRNIGFSALTGMLGTFELEK